MAALLQAGCQKDIDFKYREIEPITVIEGNLTMEYASVIITETTPVDEPMNRRHYTDATVTLEDLTDGSLIPLTPDADGIFTLPAAPSPGESAESPEGAAAGIPGHNYRLTVSRGGVTYTCQSEMLPPVRILDFGFQRVETPMGHLIVGQVAFTDNPETRGDCYIVRFFRNGELYNWGTISDIQALDNILLASFKVIDESELPDDAHQDDDLRNQLLKPGDEVRAIVVPVSRTYFDYLVALNQGSNGPLLFTSTGDFCLGYFLAAPESTATAIFDPNKLQ